MSVGLDVTAEGTRWAVERDIESGTFRVVDRDRGEDRTADFVRSGGRDVFGERVTGLSEPLFRTTAFVRQNVLEGDSLDSALTLELARIADAGGGEASVVRALRSLDAVRARMPEATTGPSVSVDTEVARARRLRDEARRETARRRAEREAAAEAGRRLALARERLEAVRRKAALLDVAAVVAERRSLAERQSAAAEAADRRRALVAEAEALLKDSLFVPEEALERIDALREERGSRPEALQKARRAQAEEREAIAQDARQRARRFGPAASLTEEDRRRLALLLSAVVDSEEEAARAEGELEEQWEDLRREGLADDLRRLDSLPASEREFLLGAEEERRELELLGVKADRRATEAADLARLVVSERNVRVAAGRRLVGAALVALVVAAALWASGSRVPGPVSASATAFAVGLGLAGAVAWVRGRGHRLADEASAREAEKAARDEAAEQRRRLSEVRLHLDQVARRAGFPDPGALVRAHRRARAADEKRRALLSRRARRDAALARRASLEEELAPFREVLGTAGGLPAASDARRLLGLIEDLERAARTALARAEALAREEARLAEEEAALASTEARLRAALEEGGLPRGLPLAEALLAAEAGRRKAARRREILEVELPARRQSAPAEAESELLVRLSALDAEVASRLSALGALPSELPGAASPEEARRAAEAAREEEKACREELAGLERELASRLHGAAEGAREGAEAEEEAEAALERALLFRDAVDLAREALAEAASSAYGDFRRGLSEAARAILSRWSLPYESMEFLDDLAVTVTAKGGRVLTKAEFQAALSTGAREQLHLVARLSALRYLGTGARGVPLLMDDPLVGSDDDRFAAAMRFLLASVLEERPVLVTTCHGLRHAELARSLPPELRLRLAVVSLSARSEAQRPGID